MSAKILVLDIETSPLEVRVWSLGDQHVGSDQITKDWHLMSFAAKWLGSKKVIYEDQRNVKNISNDKVLCKTLWRLLDEADVVIGQNSKRFDIKKINARFLYHNMKPPSTYKQIDTLISSRKSFALTSHKLAYMSKTYNEKYTKQEHREFPGMSLWDACLDGNTRAWNIMKEYNIHDVLATEEFYRTIAPWDTSVNLALYHNNPADRCNCGSTKFQQNGFHYSPSGKYQRLRCAKCGAEGRRNKNLFTQEQRRGIVRGTR